MGVFMRSIVPILLIAGALAACAPAQNAAQTASFDDATIFPAARGLARAEDGEVLADGTIIVVDQRHGLLAIAPDEATRPFGRFADAGYAHAPPSLPAGPNGISREPDGAHVLVADVFGGGIYRVNLETEATERVYAHAYGVNTAIADSTGAIWFTQSTENAPGPTAEARLLDGPFNSHLEDGALYRIPPPAANGARAPAQIVLEGLAFANGIVIDEERDRLYLAETLGNQITAYDVNLATGELSNRRVVASITTPDNIELDGRGRLWVASPTASEVYLVDPESGEIQTVFSSRTPESEQGIAEWARRREAREPVLDLFSPAMWAPLPAPITGVILTPGDGPIYISGLGDALLRLDGADWPRD